MVPLPASPVATRASGHRVDNHHQESEHRVVTTLTHSPIMGMTDFSVLLIKIHGTANDLIQSHHRPPDFHHNPTGKLPKLHFPFFNGTDLKLWITCAEDYFQMYSVDPSIWIQCS